MLVLFGLIFTVTVGAFLAMIFTSGMKSGFAKVIVTIILASAIGFGLSGLMKLDHDTDAKIWNNGICRTCGEEFKIFDIEKTKSNTTYYYQCKNGHLIETSYYFKK